MKTTAHKIFKNIFISVLIPLACLGSFAGSPTAPEPLPAKSQSAPLSYRDPDSGIIILVESDRHHVVALDKDGKILWCRQPATDGKLPPYSESRPTRNPPIVWISALTVSQSTGLQKAGGPSKFVGISFNSRQAGTLDLKNGNFTFQGQD